MSVLQAVTKRRSVRSYQPEAIPDEVLGRLLEALRLAPTGGNRQPFKFIVVRDTDKKARIASACHWIPGRPKGHEFIAEAPVVIVACGSEKDGVTRFHKNGQTSLTMGVVPEKIDKDNTEFLNLTVVDVAIALDHLSLVATEEGLGTCWVAALDEHELKKLLSVPDDMRVLFVMPVGYTTSWPEARPRKKLEDIICYERYS